ncbi:MAG TPA: tetratricopeptide repeat protein, partial [Noviherbaspirillum sp.]|nr:tetratricopeptide repeat protein [Noviherbaspirillum sp.]
GHGEQARRLLQRSLRLHPDSAHAHFMLALLSEREQDIGAAEDALRRAVYLDPDHYEALCHLAMLSERHGDAGRAARLRDRAARVYRRRELKGHRR